MVIALTIVSFGILGEVADTQAGGGRRRRRHRMRLPDRTHAGQIPRRRGPSARPCDLQRPYLNQHQCLRTERLQTGPRSSDQSAMSGSEMLRVRDLTVTTSGGREFVLVDHVTFDVRRGEVLGLVGETGAGKSVIARALLQVGGNRIASGSVVFDGMEDVELRPTHAWAGAGQTHRVRGPGADVSA